MNNCVLSLHGLHIDIKVRDRLNMGSDTRLLFSVCNVLIKGWISLVQLHIFCISASASIEMTNFDQVHREQKEAEKEGADVLPPLVL